MKWKMEKGTRLWDFRTFAVIQQIKGVADCKVDQGLAVAQAVDGTGSLHLRLGTWPSSVRGDEYYRGTTLDQGDVRLRDAVRGIGRMHDPGMAVRERPAKTLERIHRGLAGGTLVQRPDHRRQQEDLVPGRDLGRQRDQRALVPDDRD